MGLSIFAVYKIVGTLTSYKEITLETIVCYMIETLICIVKTILKIVYFFLLYLLLFLIGLFKLLFPVIAICSIMAIPFIIIYFCAHDLWDEAIRPIASLIQAFINFLVGLWNNVVAAVRSFGIRLPTADEFGQEVPTFWGLIQVIFIFVGKLIESLLKGTIIR